MNFASLKNAVKRRESWRPPIRAAARVSKRIRSTIRMGQRRKIDKEFQSLREEFEKLQKSEDGKVPRAFFARKSHCVPN